MDFSVCWVRYALDVAWIISHPLFGMANTWRRRFIPWRWAVLNGTLLVSLIYFWCVYRSLYTSTAALIWLGLLNCAGFYVDIYLINQSGLFKTTPAPAHLAMDSFLQEAIAEAKEGRSEGGIPIGSVLVVDGQVVGRGHNLRVQQGNPILHAEMACLANAGRLPARDYRRATLYTTLSPCSMCSGAILLYRIGRVVIGENRTFRGAEALLESRGVELEVRDDPSCVALMKEFIAAHPETWNEDIGE